MTDVRLIVRVKEGLELHFSGANYDENGRWGLLHLSIDDGRSRGLSVELEHEDIDGLIDQLQKAKGILVQ